MKCVNCGGDHPTEACHYNETLPPPPEGSRSGLASGPGPNKIHELIKLHASLLEENPYCYFELGYTRQTMWMAWLCSKPREDDPQRKVLACGQGETPEEAADEALKSYKDGSAAAFKVKTCWSKEKPTKGGDYWMRTKTSLGVMMVHIDNEGAVWPCSCMSTSPYDLSKYGEVEWAPVLPP